MLDSDGGGMFKFVPDVLHTGGPISDLSESPLAAGRAYAFTASCADTGSSSFPQYGQGCEVGRGAWVRVGAATARADAAGATGYYRPEGMDVDPLYEGDGVRFCWTNTENEGAGSYAEVMCIADPSPAPADPTEVVDGRTGLAYLGDAGDFASTASSPTRCGTSPPTP